MTLRRNLGRAILLLGATALAACGGGGATFGGGISGTGKPGVVFGDVDTTSGVTVAGTTFETAAAVVRIGGEPAEPGDLRDGHVALVEGIIDGAVGTAETITVEDAVKGVLQAKPSPNTLQVQGLVVEVGDRTVFGPGIVSASVDGLLLGDLLEIWGFVKDGGVIVARRIERAASISETRITGAATSVDSIAKTFDIGSQSVEYGAADVTKLAGGNPAEGGFVLVRGSVGPGGVLLADRVEPLDLHDAQENENTEIEGFVTEIVSPTMFRLGGVGVVTNAGTRYAGGSALDVVRGTHLEIEGALAGGVVSARVVEFGASVRLESDVDEVVGTLIRLVGLPGIVVKVSELTEFDGDADDVGDVAPGDHLLIRGNAAGGGTVVAVLVKETSADTDIEIQGPVDAAPAPSNPVFSVLGVAIDTTGFGEGDFESQDGAVIGRASFFELVGAGDLVKASGTLVGGSPAWEEVRIEGGTRTKIAPVQDAEAAQEVEVEAD